MGNSNNTPNENNPSSGFLASMFKKKAPQQDEPDEWEVFMNQQNNQRQIIYSNCNNTLNTFDAKKEAEKMKIVDKNFTKTECHFWVKDESLPCTYSKQGDFIEVSVKVQIGCKNPSLYAQTPAVMSVYLFAKESLDMKSSEFKGIVHGKYYGFFSHHNHEIINAKKDSKSQRKSDIERACLKRRIRQF